MTESQGDTTTMSTEDTAAAAAPGAATTGWFQVEFIDQQSLDNDNNNIMGVIYEGYRGYAYPPLFGRMTEKN